MYSLVMNCETRAVFPTPESPSITTRYLEISSISSLSLLSATPCPLQQEPSKGDLSPETLLFLQNKGEEKISTVARLIQTANLQRTTAVYTTLLIYSTPVRWLTSRRNLLINSPIDHATHPLNQLLRRWFNYRCNRCNRFTEIEDRTCIHEFGVPTTAWIFPFPIVQVTCKQLSAPPEFTLCAFFSNVAKSD